MRAAIVSRMTPAWFDHALVLCFVVLLPLAGATVTYRRLTAATGDPASRRMRFYRRTLVLQISMLVLVLAAWHAGGREWTQLGVGIPRPWHAIFALAFAMIFVWRFYRAGQREQQRIALRVVQVEQLGRLAPIMPRTRRELDLFVLLLLVAAASEEVVFRGYLTAYLRSYLPLGVAACIAVLAFAVAHAYQGPKGVVLTGAVGGLCMILYLVSGSVWPCVLLHGGCNYVGAHLGHAAVRAFPGREL